MTDRDPGLTGFQVRVEGGATRPYILTRIFDRHAIRHHPSMTTLSSSSRRRRLDDALDRFPLGRTPLVMLVLFAVACIAMGFEPESEGQVLTYWVFARTHYDDYQEAKGRFEAQHPGWRVDVKLVDLPSLMNRLTAAFVRGSGAPDACEIEISSLGRFFRGPAGEVPFEDLVALGARFGDAGWEQEVVGARLAPWTYDGTIFGMPQDVHPVALVYRRDLFAEAGVDSLPAVAGTWDDFIDVARRVTVRDTDRPRYALALHHTEVWEFWQLIHQNGGSIYDAQGQVTIDGERGVEVLQLFADLFLEHDVAFPIRDNPSFWAAVKRDEVMAFLAADWFIGFLRNNVPEQAGLWRAMPIPAWREGGRRVSTHGWTTTVIPRQGHNKQAAWAWTEFLYLDRDEAVRRALKTRVMPALHAAYEDPRLLNERFDFLGGQRLGALFAALRHEIPPVYLDATYPEALYLLRTTIYRAVRGEDSPERLLRKQREHMQEIAARYAEVEARLSGDG